MSSWSSWFGGSGGGGSGDKPASSEAFSDTTGGFRYETVPNSGSGGGGGGGSGDFQQQVQQQVLVAELQRRIGQLSGLCWEKCMSAYPKYTISSREEGCVSNCAERYLDVSALVAEGLAKKFEAS